ncbi:MAG: F0F1 ATP synthase subunit A [Isosphaeraceae bacterium]
MAEGHDSNPMSHILDHPSLEVPGFGWEIHLPNIAGFQVTRFMVMELVAAGLLCAILIPLARHVGKNRVTRGPLLNAFEAMVLFIRDQVARPAIGGHGADAFLPFLWTLFFFILGCNLLGMIPGFASATGDINVTAVLAVLVFVAVLIAGMGAMGPVKFWIGLVPHMDVPFVLKIILWPMMFLIEVAGLLIRHVVLAVRLFANMMAGHMVLAVILGFIAQASGMITFLVTPASIGGVVALSLLELFVAFLQAYIFTFLAALFIGSAAHPH